MLTEIKHAYTLTAVHKNFTLNLGEGYILVLKDIYPWLPLKTKVRTDLSNVQNHQLLIFLYLNKNNSQNSSPC